MAPLHTLLHDLAHDETRFWVVTDHETLPDGEYGLVEFFCHDLECDCRQVILHARATLDTLHPQSPHAFTYLWMFREMIVQDRPYALRFRRHYRLCKRALQDS